MSNGLNLIINENMRYDIRPESNDNDDNSFLKVMTLKEYDDEVCEIFDELMAGDECVN